MMLILYMERAMKLFVPLMGIFLFFSTIEILPTTINGRFILLDANSSNFSVMLQVNTNTGIDDLGGVTIVIGFNPNAVNFSSVPVRNVDYTFHNFDGGNYSSGFVTKPMNDKIWVNIDLPFYNSNNGSIVAQSPDWTNVITLNFIVVNAELNPGLNWQQSSLFWGIYDADNFTLWNMGTFEGNFGLTVNINNGWNMVSVPGINPDGMTVSNWWQGKNPTSNVYKFSNGQFQSITTTTPGEGYFMNHNGFKIYNTGDEWPASGIYRVPNDPIIVSAGWNLIGGYEKIIEINQITTTPPGLLTGLIYRFTDRYQIAAAMEPGYGYMLKLNGPGQINLDPGLMKGSDKVEVYFSDDWGKITFLDNSGKSYSLYLVNDDVDLNLYEIPPAPPENSFDIRFESGRIAESIENDYQTVLLRGIDYPVKVKVKNINISLEDESGTIINTEIYSGEEFTINNEAVNKLLVLSGEEMIPNEYLLSQNYPNPFNPSTKIKFDVPFDSQVELNVYNILGELVSTIVNDYLKAGQHEFEFTAANISSGIYIYRIKANDFVDTKKMILLR